MQVHWDGQLLLSSLGVRVQKSAPSCRASLTGAREGAWSHGGEGPGVAFAANRFGVRGSSPSTEAQSVHLYSLPPCLGEWAGLSGALRRECPEAGHKPRQARERRHQTHLRSICGGFPSCSIKGSLREWKQHSSGVAGWGWGWGAKMEKQNPKPRSHHPSTLGAWRAEMKVGDAVS